MSVQSHSYALDYSGRAETVLYTARTRHVVKRFIVYTHLKIMWIYAQYKQNMNQHLRFKLQFYKKITLINVDVNYYYLVATRLKMIIMRYYVSLRSHTVRP